MEGESPPRIEVIEEAFRKQAVARHIALLDRIMEDKEAAYCLLCQMREEIEEGLYR